MNLYAIIRFLHILAALVLVGGLFSRQVVRAYARKATDVRAFAEISQGANQIERLMVIPGNMAVIILGVIAALMSGAPILGFIQGASANWLLVANLLLIIGMVIVPVVFVPRGKVFDGILEKALAEGRITPELTAALDDQVVKIAHLYEQVSIVIVVALMVLKPF